MGYLAREDEQVEKSKVRMTRSASNIERSRRLEDDRKADFSERVADADAKCLCLKQQKESIWEKRRMLQGEAHKVLEQFTGNPLNQDEMQKYKHRAVKELMEDVAERGSMAGYSVPFTPR